MWEYRRWKLKRKLRDDSMIGYLIKEELKQFYRNKKIFYPLLLIVVLIFLAQFLAPFQILILLFFAEAVKEVPIVILIPFWFFFLGGPLLGVLLSYDALSRDLESKFVYFTASKISRNKILFSKFLSVVLVIFSTIFLVFGFLFFYSLIKFKQNFLSLSFWSLIHIFVFCLIFVGLTFLVSVLVKKEKGTLFYAAVLSLVLFFVSLRRNFLFGVYKLGLEFSLRPFIEYVVVAGVLLFLTQLVFKRRDL